MENKISGDQLFMGLVYSLTQSAFIGLGKLPDPMSGKIERDLDQAAQTIDLLAALLDKTKGNLAAEEESFIRRTVSDLRLNYVDEVNKAKNDKQEEQKKKNAEKKDKPDVSDKEKTAGESAKTSEKEDEENSKK